jgi:ribosomal 50S subunit-recycling heat shock protein
VEEIMRIDKFLKNARIIKRRTIAKEACDQGRVFINDKVSKAGDEVKIGDEVQINFGSGSMKFRILDIKDNLKKDDATTLYENID